MKAEIVKKTPDLLMVKWEKEGVGFGRLLMVWSPAHQEYIIDSELMGIDFIIDVFQALPKDVLTRNKVSDKGDN